ncbi:GntR family transcriptional regulator [Azospirillum doebereinerae]|uniref:GntR family transcriptional regulator n=1 Tax=Azospirillum doebereinerae TaxID=92933 RepID=UPI00163BD6BC|nr:GntR family transcriptional regulator [Azospirillum doebereinerae]MCG5238327.1 GntR family transcriptional regulator [Azospirillum doebereinerae]
MAGADETALPGDPSTGDEPGKEGRRTETLYYRVARTLIAEIDDGTHPTGSVLPGEMELTRRFGVSRHTVREALRRLEDLGLIRRRTRTGTEVLGPRRPSPYQLSLTTTRELLAYLGETTLHVHETGPADPAALAAYLPEAEAAGWWRIATFRTAPDGTPVSWTDIYIPGRYRGIIDRIGATETSFYRLLEQEFGETVENIVQELSATALGGEIAEILERRAGSPALRIARCFHNPLGTLIEIAVSVYPEDRFRYVLSLHRNQAGHSA